jgi:hypothetical protein
VRATWVFAVADLLTPSAPVSSEPTNFASIFAALFMVYPCLEKGMALFDAGAGKRANGKLWADYWRNQSTQEFATELARSMGIPIDLLVGTFTFTGFIAATPRITTTTIPGRFGR